MSIPPVEILNYFSGSETFQMVDIDQNETISKSELFNFQNVDELASHVQMWKNLDLSAGEKYCTIGSFNHTFMQMA